SGDLRRVSPAGGRAPKWRADGRELFYVTGDHQLTAVEVRTGSEFVASSGSVLFRIPEEWISEDLSPYPYEVSPDGQKFCFSVRASSAMRPPVTVLLNWSANLQ